MASPTVQVTEQVQQVVQAPQGSVQIESSQLVVTQPASGQVIVQASPVTVTIQSQPVTVQIPEVRVLVVDVGIQGPQGPPGQSGAAPNFQAENKTVLSFLIGQPLAIHPSGTGVVLASAASPSLSFIGVATVGVSPGLDETVQAGGIFQLGDWTAICGTATLLPQATYYLSTLPGLLTTTAPITAGEIVQPVGRAVSGTQLELLAIPVIIL